MFIINFLDNNSNKRQRMIILNNRYFIFNNDYFNIVKKIKDKSIDLILTDPPYNISKYSRGNIVIPGRKAINNNIANWDKIDINPNDLANEFVRILKPNGNIFVFTGYNKFGDWHSTFDPLFDTFQFMVWHKLNPTPKIYKTGFLNSCELIACMWNKGHKWNFSSQKSMHNFLESSTCTYPERLKSPFHPTQKPIDILEKIIKISTYPNDLVFDPFMGVGSTGVAALKLNRRFLGVEINNEYFLASKQRLQIFK